MHTYQLLQEILQALNISHEKQADADLLKLIGVLAQDDDAATRVEEFARAGFPIFGNVMPPKLEALAQELGIEWPRFEGYLHRLARIHRLLKFLKLTL